MLGGGNVFKPPLDRTRSGWLKDSSLDHIKSLKGDPIKHMGCSLPAIAFPLETSPEHDPLDSRPEPVTLFIGIIDFLQVTCLTSAASIVLDIDLH